MKKQKIDEALEALEGVEMEEIVSSDLTAVLSGVDTMDDGTNGNCTCPVGSPVPGGTWTNGNCPWRETTGSVSLIER